MGFASGGSTMRLASSALCLVLRLWLVLAAVEEGSALAGPALDDAKQPPPPAADEPDCSKTPDDARCQALGVTADADGVIEYGVGVRLRSVWVPKSILELFVTRSAGGAQNYGIGVDLSRRHGTTELQLGFEYENVSVGQGVWINKGDDVSMGDEADYVLGPDASGHHLGWFTIEFTFLNHAEITKSLAVRYGGGLGLGILTGELDHYNIVCVNATNSSPEPGCVAPRFTGNGRYSDDPGGETQVAYGLPPVFPVVNAILGLQFKPTHNVTINLEGGIRTLPFLGVSSSMFF
jgi:hypothetical protein